jgi:hypothetical protein
MAVLRCSTTGDASTRLLWYTKRVDRAPVARDQARWYAGYGVVAGLPAHAAGMAFRERPANEPLVEINGIGKAEVVCRPGHESDHLLDKRLVVDNVQVGDHLSRRLAGPVLVAHSAGPGRTGDGVLAHNAVPRNARPERRPGNWWYRAKVADAITSAVHGAGVPQVAQKPNRE